MDKAKELEKKYEWLQATEYYKKAIALEIDEKNILKATKLEKKIGYCYYRASFQAQSNIEFRKLMKMAVKSYENQSEYLGTKKEENKIKINQVNASIVYLRSWLEKDLSKKKKILEEWWILQNQVIKEYEKSGNLHSFGLACNDLFQNSLYPLFGASSDSERVRIGKQIQSLAEKAIQSLQKSGDNYQLARAYWLVSAWYKVLFDLPELSKKGIQLFEIVQKYSKKALDLSFKIRDATLICNCYINAWVIAFFKGDTELANEYSEKTVEYSRITKDKRQLLAAVGIGPLSMMMSIEFWEDPDKQREICEEVRKIDQDIIRMSKIIDYTMRISQAYHNEVWALLWLAIVETDPQNKKNILLNTIEQSRKYIELFKEWRRISAGFYQYLSSGLFLLAQTKSEIEDKEALLVEADSYQEKYLTFFPGNSPAYYNLALGKIKLANIKTDKKEKVMLLKQAVIALNKSDESIARYWNWQSKTVLQAKIYGKHSDLRGKVLQKIYHITKERKSLSEAIEAHKKAAFHFTKGELLAHAAESYWNIAQLQGQKSEHQIASKNYESASKAYNQAAKKIPQLEDFYKDYSLYMQAWNHIEQARYFHSIEEFNNSKHQYTKAAELHELTDSWSYLAPNYFAWANMEEAESLSRNETTQQAKEAFQKALRQFAKAEKSIKQKVGDLTSPEETELNQRLLDSSDHRRKYCQARIQIEDAKLLDMEGKYLQSSKRYEEAAQSISILAKELDVEAERKELEYVAVLCQAWREMATAEETASSELYLEAAKFFEQAKEYCHTRKASLWALGNSNFCRGLAAGVEYQTTLNVEDHNRAKGYIQNAATNYFKAGYENASEYAKATLRLFDAYLFMNQAERETDTAKRVKQYQLAENLLQLASNSFTEAQQPEKAVQVKQILGNVREEKELAISFNEVLQAPLIASTTQSFTAPSPTNEVSVGLESFQHANVQANLIAGAKEVRVGESFCLSVEFVNAGKEPALLMRVEDFVPPDFIVAKKPEIYRLEESCLNMKGKQIAPLKLVEAKLILQPSKKGIYPLQPTVHYLDELGQNRVLQLKSAEIKVEKVVLADRVSTGTKELDSLLLGGIPEEYAIVLTGSPSDERELLIRNFLEAGIEKGEASFYVTTEADRLECLLEKSGFYLFLCNLRPKVEVPDLPNVYKLHGKTDLNNLGIALVKAYRRLSKKPGLSRRVCVQILSDVLVNYGSKTARKWVSELITDLGSKGFTILAVVNPEMHTPDQTGALLDLFDGEISLTQTEDSLECRKSVVVEKLRNQDYIKNSICLSKSR